MGLGIRGMVAAALMALPGTVWAEDVALVIANRFYDGATDAPQVRAIEALAPDLRAAGYDVLSYTDVSSDEFGSLAAEAARRISRADRVLILLGGHMVQTARDGFLLFTDAGSVNALSAPANGVSVAALMDLASDAQVAVVAVADSRWTPPAGPGVSDGYTPAEVPEGITVLTGVPNLMARYLTGELLRPNRTVAEAAAAAPAQGIAVFGTPPDLPLIAGDGPGVSLEEAIWDRAEGEGTVAAYEDYLRRYPEGLYAQTARDRIQRLTESPVERAARLEASLELTRAQRNQIQRDLTTLGYYDRGIDGVFGQGTRSGIAEWQAVNGFDRTGYITANQIALLRQQAETRAAEIAAERERQDRQFWQDTGQGADEAGLRAYLDRFPDGIYSDLARERLAAIEAERQAQEEARDRAAWQRARAADTVPAYRRYLQEFPDGLFAERAEAALDRLTQPGPGDPAFIRARQEEEGLNLAPTGRRLIELRLQMLNLAPGPVDGVFDQQTRQAIRRYQQDQGLLPTGFITQATLARLLAGAVLP